MAPPIGFKHSDEAKIKIGIASMGNKFCLGRKLSEEHKLKISESNAGKVHKITEETREKLRKSHLGKIPSNKGKKGLFKHSEEFKKSLSERTKKMWQDGKIIPLKGTEHSGWKGNLVGYRALHHWVVRNLGKAVKCLECGLDKIPEGKKRYFQWANKSHEYKRILSDWKQLCIKCHKQIDVAYRKVNY